MARISTMTDQERARVSAAVQAAEAHTAGEIVTILTRRSDDYADVALVWSLAVGLIALLALTVAPDFYLGLYERLSGGWVHQWTPRGIFGLALLVATLKAGGMWLILLWRPLRLWLTPAPIRHARVRGRAVTCFRVGAERRTHGRTGILIYLSLDEHRAEIGADEAIAAKVAPEVWGEAMAAMLAELKQDHLGDGLTAAIGRVGAVLALHFPRAEDDRNQLPDRLIEV